MSMVKPILEPGYIGPSPHREISFRENPQAKNKRNSSEVRLIVMEITRLNPKEYLHYRVARALGYEWWQYGNNRPFFYSAVAREREGFLETVREWPDTFRQVEAPNNVAGHQMGHIPDFTTPDHIGQVFRSLSERGWDYRMKHYENGYVEFTITVMDEHNAYVSCSEEWLDAVCSSFALAVEEEAKKEKNP
jgi:hypothetical protein